MSSTKIGKKILRKKQMREDLQLGRPRDQMSPQISRID